MKAKSLISIYVILLCLFTIFTFNVNAATNHSHFSCGNTCNHDTAHEQISMSVFTTYSSSGNRYLNSDITMNKDLVIKSDMILCLNGYALTFEEEYGIFVEEGATFEICDCIGNGEILQSSDTNGFGISMIGNSGEMFIYSGNIAVNGERNLTSIYNSGVMEIYGGKVGTDISNSGTMRIYGGSIIGDTEYQYASLGNDSGGTLYIYNVTIENNYPVSNNGTAYMYGSKILGTCNENGISSRAAINNYGGKLYLDGAYIESSSDTAIASSSSYNSSTGKIINPTLTITNSNIKAETNPKAVAVSNHSGNLTITASTITGKYIGIRSSSGLTGTNNAGANCTINRDAVISGGTYGVYNDSSKSTQYNSGYTTVYISHSILTVNNGAKIDSIYARYPKAIYYNNRSEFVTDIYIEEANFETDSILGYSTNIQNLNLMNNNYYLYNQYGNIYVDSRCIGDNVWWTLTKDGILTISGTGAMDDFNMPYNQPWYNGRLGIEIKEVIIEEGITHIGSSAFEQLDITKATISSSVKTIGYYAFMNCDCLEKIIIPSGITQIQRSAFNHCEALNEITIPATVTNIGDNSFYNCVTLTDVNYEGSKSEWKSINIGTSNNGLNNANIHYGRDSFINVNVSNDNKTFTISPQYVGKGNLVILALYDGMKLVDIQPVVYEGEAIPFTTTKSYTGAKVMVWESLNSLSSVCSAELIQ